MMKIPGARLSALALLIPVAGLAQEGPPKGPAPSASTPSDLGFLEVGRAYQIRFPEGMHPVQLKESEVVAQPSGSPATFRMNYQVNVFVVRKLGGGSWALLEHPTDPKESADILAARSLLADRAKVAEIEADPDRKEFLARRRKAALGEVKTTQTWINLAHALAISDPPPPDARWEIKFNVEAR